MEGVPAVRAVASAVFLLLICFPISGQQSPPHEAGSFRKSELVELISIDPTLALDIRYATPHNFAGAAVYSEARAFLQRPAAEALARVQQRLRPVGYGLVVYDAYRPWS